MVLIQKMTVLVSLKTKIKKGRVGVMVGGGGEGEEGGETLQWRCREERLRQCVRAPHVSRHARGMARK